MMLYSYFVDTQFIYSLLGEGSRLLLVSALVKEPTFHAGLYLTDSRVVQGFLAVLTGQTETIRERFRGS